MSTTKSKSKLSTLNKKITTLDLKYTYPNGGLEYKVLIYQIGMDEEDPSRFLFYPVFNLFLLFW